MDTLVSSLRVLGNRIEPDTNMHTFLSTEAIEQLIREDVPYFDLTTFALDIGNTPGRIVFTTRHPTVICGTEEAARLLELCGATVTSCLGSGSMLAPGMVCLEANGSAQALHRSWKVAVNLLEYMSGIATRTHELVETARRTNPTVAVVTTRKVFPGTKALAVKAVLAGGAVPHRLGLSETVLVFAQHRAFLGGLQGFIAMLETMRQTCEKKTISVEVDNLQDALVLARAGVDAIQFDKLPVAELSQAVRELRNVKRDIKLAIAGGVNAANIAAYAATGVNIIVTTSVYFGQPADIGVSMEADRSAVSVD